ncbi:DUF4244 domain-containing protein [Kribbia dieselivorans]|uniref:DUF4244 domain-containing protein n=1 Tax=Kribbia dieselivorans TaxID=331526 RepID=UPI0009FB863E|nr:DUF4244 domain-containing protein [Kribbia dieselivorans]
MHATLIRSALAGLRGTIGSTVRPRRESGMTTAEYAVGVLVACSLAMVMLGIVKSGPVKDALTQTVLGAVGLGG